MAKPEIKKIPTVALFTKSNEKTTFLIEGIGIDKTAKKVEGKDLGGGAYLGGEYGDGKIKKDPNGKGICVAEIKCIKEHTVLRPDIDQIEITITNKSDEKSDPFRADAVDAS